MSPSSMPTTDAQGNIRFAGKRFWTDDRYL